MRSVTVKTGQPRFQQSIEVGPHHWVSDEPLSVGGSDAGPSPFELVAAGLASCTSMTVKMYAERKGWTLDSVQVQVSYAKRGDEHVFSTRLSFSGNLTPQQVDRLHEIADRCPVHRALAGHPKLESVVVDRF